MAARFVPLDDQRVRARLRGQARLPGAANLDEDLRAAGLQLLDEVAAYAPGERHDRDPLFAADRGRHARELTVTNPTSRDATPADGHGIVGMRERTALLQGSLEARAGAGLFRVRARLPYGGGDRQRP